LAKKKSSDTVSAARRALDLVAGETSSCLARVQAVELVELVDAVLSAKRVFVTGCGRSGLVARAFAMRLMHMKIDAHVIAETTTPSCGEGDLLVAISGSGEKTTTLLRATEALSFGASLAAVTGNEDAMMWNLSGVKLVVPRLASEQFGGSLFEQSTLLVLDAVVMLLRERLDAGAEDMRSRHASVE